MTWSLKLNKENILSPTTLTILRGVLALILPFFILGKEPNQHLWAAIIFTVAALTDFFDGWAARKFNRITELGKILDPTTDKMLILIPLYLYALMGFYSPWWLVPIFIRELSVTFCRIAWMVNGQAIAAEQLGKWKFGFQVAVIGFAMLHHLSEGFSGMSFMAGPTQLLMMISLVVAGILTVISGITFFLSNQKLFHSEYFARVISAVGVGFLKPAPGTWGSGIGMIIIILCHWNLALYGVVFLSILSISYWAGNRINLKENKDPSYVVTDEVLGMMVSFFLIPLSFSSIVTGFVIFRLLDILKPPPCRQMESYKGYTGILADDLMAGVYTWVILFIAFGIV